MTKIIAYGEEESHLHSTRLLNGHFSSIYSTVQRHDSFISDVNMTLEIKLNVSALKTVHHAALQSAGRI